MLKVCLDYGHGGRDPGAIYKGRCEKDDMLKLGAAISKELRKQGVLVDETRTTDKTMSLRERSNKENGKNYDYFISLHRNAYKPEQANGVEAFTYMNQTLKARKMADKLQKGLVGVGFKNRGVKKANFHVLRETKAPAVLIEIGFIDSSIDNEIFDNEYKKIVEVITAAIRK